jgi:hypothetical protein
VRYQQFGPSSTSSEAEADVGCALVVRVLDDLLQTAGGFAVDLFGEALTTLDDLVDEPRKLQLFKAFDCLFGGLGGEFVIVGIAALKQLLDEFQARISFSLDLEVRTNPGAPLTAVARSSGTFRLRLPGHGSDPRRKASPSQAGLNESRT